MNQKAVVGHYLLHISSDNKYMPFLRIGDSDGGALLERMVSAGLGLYNWDTK